MFESSARYLFARAVKKALAQWSFFRETRRELETWFRGKIANERRADINKSPLIHILRAAVSEHAHGVAFVERELLGFMSWETTDTYWTLSPSPPDIREPGATAAEVEYLVRYKHMSRIDIYHIIHGEAILTGGIPNVFHPIVHALESCLRKPRDVAIAPITGDAVVQCELSLVREKRFAVCPLLHVDIRYKAGQGDRWHQGVVSP